jgi:predicted nucleic acid-binding protein
VSTLVDTNVFVDLLKSDAIWMPWSVEALAQARRRGPVLTSWVVYAELHTHDTAGPHIDHLLNQLSVALVDMEKASAQMAAQAFRLYRQRGGTKTGVLPDFFIGAHAQSQGWTLLTRDGARYRTYFPDLAMVCP